MKYKLLLEQKGHSKRVKSILKNLSSFELFTVKNVTRHWPQQAETRNNIQKNT